MLITVFVNGWNLMVLAKTYIKYVGCTVPALQSSAKDEKLRVVKKSFSGRYRYFIPSVSKKTSHRSKV